MLPITLQLRNFLSYGEGNTMLDFRGLSLACLSGDNGVGKSSLLEAITWALWGSARVPSDDALIRVGSIDMEVIFTFEVESNTYRVIRKRSRKRKNGVSTLEFQILEKGKGIEEVAAPAVARSEGWRSITEPSIRATQEKIIFVLGMSYETFVNSAFVRQGHADEFTLKRPGDRKAILADILGLGLYDRLVERARMKARMAETAKNSITLFLDRAKETGFDVGELKATEQATLLKLTEASTLLSNKEEAVRVLRDEVTKSKVAAARFEALNRQLQQLSRFAEDLRKKIATLESEQRELSGIVDHREDILKLAHEYEIVSNTVRQLQEKKAKQGDLLARREEVQRLLQGLVDGIQKEIQSIEGQKSVLKERTKKASDAKLRLRELQEKLAEHVQLKQSLDQTQERMSKLQNELTRLEEQSKHIHDSGEDVKSRQVTISKARSACPLCKQKLTPAHRTTITEDLSTELKSLRTEYAENRRLMKEVRMELDGLQGSLTEMRKTRTQFEELKEQEGVLKNIIDEQELAKGTLSLLAESLNKLNSALESDPQIARARSLLTKITNELEVFAVDEKVYQSELQRFHELQKAAKQKQELDIAETNVSHIGKQLTDLRIALKENERERLSLTEEQLLTQAAGTAAEHLERELVLQEEELTELRREVQGFQKEVDRAQDALKEFHSEQQRISDQRAELKRYTQEQALYEQLAEMFGKRGIQATIIDAAIPEIEDEANTILSRMTGNQMHITFELQREKKSTEGVIETLDIKISDEVGTRNYELFSGGEAFRINFAIRVALSRLLARRAGAKLRMLIIDEGFGSQDEIGRDHLVAAIRAIRTEFDKIIVITHIPELKDAFAERIQIIKTPLGSQIQMIS